MGVDRQTPPVAHFTPCNDVTQRLHVTCKLQREIEMTTKTTDLVDRLAWSRARRATGLAAVFAGAQVSSFNATGATLNRPETIQLVAWIVWAIALAVFIAASGGLFRGARVRALLNDETTLDHRRRAMTWGFWAAIAAAATVFALTFVEPITARESARLVITAAIVVALLRFGTLERKALKDG